MDDYYDDNFDDLMADAEIGDFSAFTLSKEEIEQGKKERREQLQKDVLELKELVKKAESTKEAGGSLSNEEIRRMKKLSRDKMAVMATMSDEYTIEELVDIENGDYKKEKKETEKEERRGDGVKEAVEALRAALESSDPIATLAKSGKVKIVGYEPEESEDSDELEEPAKSTSKRGRKVTVFYDFAEDKARDENEEDSYNTITVVTKKYWDNNHRLADDHKGTNGSLFDAMETVGCSEETDSVFATYLTEEEFIEKMAKQGFKMVKNQDFSDFIKK